MRGHTDGRRLGSARQGTSSAGAYTTVLAVNAGSVCMSRGRSPRIWVVEVERQFLGRATRPAGYTTTCDHGGSSVYV